MDELSPMQRMLPTFLKDRLEEVTASVLQEFQHIFRSVPPDSTYSLEQMEAYLEWRRRLDAAFGEAGLSDAELAEALSKLAMCTDDKHKGRAEHFAQQLLERGDFEHFAAFMQDDSHWKQQLRHVRLFWDLENIGLDEMQTDASKLVRDLMDFLQASGYARRTIRIEMYAFLPVTRFGKSPSGHWISPEAMAILINQLCNARVRVILSKAKKESADHELKSMIQTCRNEFEDHSLSTGRCAFVILSSDQDFNPTQKELFEAGYRTVVVHEAVADGHQQMLTAHAVESFRWTEVTRVPKRQSVCKEFLERGECPRSGACKLEHYSRA
ncbi:unnamed protein product [Effrenium voratum]|uniref:C3H1-type domain-containing protein n=1 Tax=Effrenium voratum TaxID=2562239 RepID=A0AA36J079_9DINO|nr:unnamed protein product [Effrenium voratum]